MPLKLLGVFALIWQTSADSSRVARLPSQYGYICAMVTPDGAWRRRIPNTERWDFKLREEMETLSCWI